jgi:hypothetical protein
MKILSSQGSRMGSPNSILRGNAVSDAISPNLIYNLLKENRNLKKKNKVSVHFIGNILIRK